MPTPVIYPAALPAPQRWQETPSERRALAGMDSIAPASARALQRDYAATAQASWVLTPAQYAAWFTWWQDTLVYGGAWFKAATWPTPRGQGVICRYQGAPVVGHLGRGVRSVQATLEVRGASLDPQEI
jgi:hypothetical protein